MKRTISLLLVLVLLVSLIPSALAVEETGQESITETLTETPAEESSEPDAEEPTEEEPAEEPEEETPVETPEGEEISEEISGESVSFTIWQEGTVVTVYTLTAEGEKNVCTQVTDSTVVLPAGNYYYDAVCEGCTSLEAVPFTVTEDGDNAVDVWLLSEERAETEHTEGTIIFSVLTESSGSAVFTQGLNNILAELGITDVNYFFSSEWEEGGYQAIYIASIDDDNLWYAIDVLSAMEGIGYAEADVLYHTTDWGDYTELKNPWSKAHLHREKQKHYENLGVEEVWAELETAGTTPGAGTIVAVIDTGVDYTHEDLHDNMWVNEAELNGTSGVDDDGNGYVDDIYGYNFVSKKGDPMDDQGHGTHVAGIIAMADDEDNGGVGLAYGTKIMAIKAGQADGSFSAVNIAAAVRYAKANGADVINMSFGGTSKSSIVEAALQEAYSQCVLVAAAGNDGLPTTDAIEYLVKEDVYPAGYSYVIGVMATDEEGTALASFSNWDYKIGANCEYEIAAPGENIYSTLPGNRYAYWSGTSMAAPLVSAAAAVLRSKYSDRDVYSTRFIMGQLIGASQQTATFNDSNVSRTYPALDLSDAINLTPTPELSVTDVKAFDLGNGDGTIQNGETVELGIELTNRWGTATDIQITADGLSANDVDPDFVTFETSSTTMNDVGTYATVNNYIYTDDVLTGASAAIRFTVHDDVANGVKIPINIHVTAKNGLNGEDAATYTADYTYILTIENGRVISGILEENTTLTADHLWIIRGSLQVPEGMTLTVEAGAQLYFERVLTGNSSVDSYNYPFLQILGEAYFNGTEDDPINISTDSYFAIVGAKLKSANDGQSFNWISASFAYAIPNCRMSYVCFAGEKSPIYPQNGTWYNFSWLTSLISCKEADHMNLISAAYAIPFIEKSKLENCSNFLNRWYIGGIYNQAVKGCSIKNSDIWTITANQNYDYSDNVLISPVSCTSRIFNTEPGLTGEIDINSNAFFLSKNTGSWAPIIQESGEVSLAENYWGTDNIEVVNDYIIDSKTIVSYGTITVDPILTSTDDLSSIYPFVVDAWLTDEEGNRIDTVSGAQTVTFHVRYNRDMEQTVLPEVTYGGATPYGDYTVYGTWVSAREWQGTMYINPLVNYGTMYIVTTGGCADDDNWLVCQRDEARFSFTIVNNSAQSMTLQTNAQSDGIHLEWLQDDFDTMAGFNLYRGQTVNATTNKVTDAKKINSSILSSDTKTYIDPDVEEGETYYYYFTVVQTDFKESDASNISGCVALDMTLPVISHTPTDALIKGTDLTVSAKVTDNVKVDSVKLYYRMSGAATWSGQDMPLSGTADTYFTRVTADSTGTLEYYVEAYDGVNYATYGTAETPNIVSILESAVQKGDVNFTGSVDIADLMLIARSVARQITLGTNQKTAADIDGNGSVNVLDLMAVALYICGKTDTL